MLGGHRLFHDFLRTSTSLSLLACWRLYQPKWSISQSMLGAKFSLLRRLRIASKYHARTLARVRHSRSFHNPKQTQARFELIIQSFIGCSSNPSCTSFPTGDWYLWILKCSSKTVSLVARCRRVDDAFKRNHVDSVVCIGEIGVGGKQACSFL